MQGTSVLPAGMIEGAASEWPRWRAVAHKLRRLPWFIVCIEPQRETTVSAFMKGHRIGCYSPEYTKVVRASVRATREVTRPLFPGYIFVRINNYQKQAGRVLATPGVRRFMRTATGLAVLPWFVIEQLRGVEEAEKPMASWHSPSRTMRAPGTMKPEDQGLMTEASGAFARLRARLVSTDEGDRLKVVINMFGQEVPAEIDADWIEPVDSVMAAAG